MAVATESPWQKRSNSANLLVEATAALLAEHSTLDVSLSDIAKRSGLNSALIKYYFGNKQGLLLAVLERDAERAMQALENLVAMSISADQKIRIHIRGIINAYFRSPYLNRLIHYMIEHGDEPASARVSSMFVEPMLKAYRSIIDQGVQERIFDQIDPGFLYYTIAGSCENLFYAAYSVPSTLSEPCITEELKQKYISHVTQVFLNGMRKR